LALFLVYRSRKFGERGGLYESRKKKELRTLWTLGRGLRALGLLVGGGDPRGVPVNSSVSSRRKKLHERAKLLQPETAELQEQAGSKIERWQFDLKRKKKVISRNSIRHRKPGQEAARKRLPQKAIGGLRGLCEACFSKKHALEEKKGVWRNFVKKEGTKGGRRGS